MTVTAAAVLLLLSIIGIVLSAVFMKQKKTLCIAVMIICIILTVVFAGYIGLTILLVDAVQNMPPSM